MKNTNILHMGFGLSTLVLATLALAMAGWSPASLCCAGLLIVYLVVLLVECTARSASGRSR